MTKKPSVTPLYVLPGGALASPPLADLLPLIPVETWTATGDWVEGLTDERLVELAHEHVLRAIRTGADAELGLPAWRKLAEVLLTELLQRTEARTQTAPAPAPEQPAEGPVPVAPRWRRLITFTR